MNGQEFHETDVETFTPCSDKVVDFSSNRPYTNICNQCGTEIIIIIIVEYVAHLITDVLRIPL
jgi:hypothetical protein